MHIARRFAMVVRTELKLDPLKPVSSVSERNDQSGIRRLGSTDSSSKSMGLEKCGSVAPIPQPGNAVIVM